MKRLFILAMLIPATVAPFVSAQSPTKTKRVDRIAVEIAEAYKANDLGRLDRARLIRGRLRIVIGYAFLDEKDEQPDTVRRFRSFKSVEAWLKNRAAKGIDNPSRRVEEFAGCSKGSCTFDDLSGSLHNQLYLEEVLYGYRNGRLFIKEIRLWNGD